LVEIEFKHNARDGRYKLLDVNARPWGFISIGLPANVDFPYLMYSYQVGLVPEPCRGQEKVGWLRLVTDLPTAFRDLLPGHLSFSSYIESLRNTRTESVFCKEDPLPSLAEFLLLPYLAAKKYL